MFSPLAVYGVCFYFFCVCVKLRGIYKKVVIDIYTKNETKLQDNRGIPNSLCQKNGLLPSIPHGVNHLQRTIMPSYL